MRIQSQLTDGAVLEELGRRLRRTRLERNLTQIELATEAGIERKVVQRIEAGGPVGLVSFVRLLRALDLLDGLDRLVPEPAPSPVELLKLHGKQRQRAAGSRAKGGSGHGQAADGSWRWGDEIADDSA
jgi:transcriptional regulator with XRE-family HTH domain